MLVTFRCRSAQSKGVRRQARHLRSVGRVTIGGCRMEEVEGTAKGPELEPNVRRAQGRAGNVANKR